MLYQRFIKVLTKHKSHFLFLADCWPLLVGSRDMNNALNNVKEFPSILNCPLICSTVQTISLIVFPATTKLDILHPAILSQCIRLLNFSFAFFLFLFLLLLFFFFFGQTSIICKHLHQSKCQKYLLDLQINSIKGVMIRVLGHFWQVVFIITG